MEKSQKVTILSSIILVGFVFGVIYHFILSHYFNYGTTYNSFLYPSSFAFCDLFSILPYIKDFKPYQEITLWVVYFPLTYILMLPFAFIKNAILSYCIYISGFVAYLIFMNIKSFYCTDLSKLQNFRNICIITVISYPFLYILDKGNFDMFLFIFFGLWAYAFKTEKYRLSAVLLGIINAIKPFTVMFLLLYLFKKNFKDFFLSTILTAMLVVGGFMFFQGGFVNQIKIFMANLESYRTVYTLGSDMRMGFNSSIFIPLKTILLYFSNDLFSSFLPVKIYDYICYVITAITMFFVWREKIFWKQLTLLICNFLLLPYMTYDYKLLFLFIPIWLFVNEKGKFKLDLAYIILFALLFIPKNIIIFLPSINNNLNIWLSLSAIVNPIIMIILSSLILWEQFYKKKEI